MKTAPNRTVRYPIWYVPPGHEPFGCFEDPLVRLARRLPNGPTIRFQPQITAGGVFRGAFGESKRGEVVSQSSEPVVRWPTWSRLFSTDRLPNIIRLGNRPLFCRTILPSEEEPAFVSGWSFQNALAFRLLEGVSRTRRGISRCC